jgi:hypothetical protein
MRMLNLLQISVEKHPKIHETKKFSLKIYKDEDLYEHHQKSISERIPLVDEGHFVRMYESN